MTFLQLEQFDTIEDMKEYLSSEIQRLDNQINNYSTLIGEKLRNEEKNITNNELDDFKSKLTQINEPKSKDGKNNTKKTKKSTKKNINSQWLNFEGIRIFNGVGIKGELELYFKALDEMKTKNEILKNNKNALENLTTTGIKKDLNCVSLNQLNGALDVAFVKNNNPKRKFAFKSICSLPCEVHT